MTGEKGVLQNFPVFIPRPAGGGNHQSRIEGFKIGGEFFHHIGGQGVGLAVAADEDGDAGGFDFCKFGKFLFSLCKPFGCNPVGRGRRDDNVFPACRVMGGQGDKIELLGRHAWVLNLDGEGRPEADLFEVARCGDAFAAAGDQDVGIGKVQRRVEGPELLEPQIGREAVPRLAQADSFYGWFDPECLRHPKALVFRAGYAFGHDPAAQIGR